MGNTYRSKQYRKRKNKEILIRCVFSKYRHRAKYKGIEFTLSHESFASVIVRNCYICGQKPSNKYVNAKGPKYGVLFYSGIDRVDNSVGYVDGNVMPCCSKCNSMKSKLSHSDFKKHIKKISRFIAWRLKWL